MLLYGILNPIDHDKNNNERLLYVALTFLFLQCKVVILCPSRFPVPSSHDKNPPMNVNIYLQVKLLILYNPSPNRKGGTKEEPLFLGQDVAEWIENKNVSQMLNVVDEEEKALYTMYRVDGSTHKQWFLTEDGLYEVLMQSRKPVAKQFKKKVILEVLMDIRKARGTLFPSGSENCSDSFRISG